MIMKVCKFGGTSMANAKTIKIVEGIVRSDKTRRFVVVSAPGKRWAGDDKTTDLLLGLKRAFDKNEDYQPILRRIEDRFCEIERALGTHVGVQNELELVAKNLLAGEGVDYVASRGEYLSAKIFAELLDMPFVDSKDIVKFSANELDYLATIKGLKRALSGLDGAVVAGFYGSDENGKIKTFSRGGSDITGALVARAVRADVYENWTDVDGVYDGDPKKDKSAKLIEKMTFDDMFKLAANGANVLHKDAVYPVQEAGIPINVRNTFNQSSTGTWIE